MLHLPNTRRSFVIALFSVVGASVFARQAQALSKRIVDAVERASRLLSPLGVHVEADVQPRTNIDILRFTVHAHDDIRYEKATYTGGGLDLCWLESSLRDDVEFTTFNMSTGEPKVELKGDDAGTTIDIFDPQMILQIAVAGGASYALENGELVRTS
jgi:hypothetical protein